MWYWNKLIPTLVISSILLSSIVSIPPAYSLNLSEIQRLEASDAADLDTFGISVSISGDTAIVGASMVAQGIDPGSAYVFEKNGGTWTQVAKLTASDAAADDQFGRSVSIFGDTAIVGAVGDNPGGSAYIFVKPGGGWVDSSQEDAKLTASDAAGGDLFGVSVSISGDTAIIGANSGSMVSNPGSAYVFVKPGGGWVDSSQEDAKLTASDGAAGDQFGFSVSISGATAIVGALLDDDVPNDSGSAYVFVKPGGGWVDSSQEDAKLTASDAAGGDLFGISVSISGDTAIVGANGDNSATGAAYVFVKPGGGWVDSSQEDAKLTASDAAAGDNFGFSVSISGDTAIIGAIRDGDVPNVFGSAYVFVKPGGGWVDSSQEDAKLTASDGADGDLFGISVSIFGDTVLVGANKFGNPCLPTCDSGAAYVFELNFQVGGGTAIGGEIIPIDTTMVLAAGAQYTAAWMIPVIVSAIGIGIFVVSRKSE